MAKRWYRITVTAIAPLLAVATAMAAQQQSTWQPPRTPDGHPDIQGMWQGTEQACNFETSICHQDGQAIQGRTQSRPPKSIIIDPADGKMPYQPWAAAQREAMEARRNTPLSLRDIASVSRCLPAVPRIGGFQIVQSRDSVVMAWERAHGYRIIPLTAAPHVGDSVKLLLGDPRGRWEGNSLVVESTNFNDWTWLDSAAAFHSDAMRAVERFTLIDANTLDYRATITDPKVFTRPWTIVAPQRRAGPPSPRDPLAGEFIEDSCVEGNERNLSIMLGKTPSAR